jgi:hypothetical protein
MALNFYVEKENSIPPEEEDESDSVLKGEKNDM